MIFLKDGTYFSSFPASWHAACDPISTRTSNYIKRLYPKARTLPANIRTFMAAKLKTTQSAEPIVAGVAALSLGSYQPDSGTEASHTASSTFHTNTSDTGTLDVGTGDGGATGHSPSIFHTANIGIDLTDASNLDTVSYAMTGHSYGWHGDGGAASGGGSYSGGGDGGGSAGAM